MRLRGRSVDTVLSGHIGHPELLNVKVGRLRRELWRLIEHESKQPLEPGCLPSLFEWKFGPLAIAATQGDEGRMALHIHGIIDRVDLGAGKALVLDYNDFVISGAMGKFDVKDSKPCK